MSTRTARTFRGFTIVELMLVLGLMVGAIILSVPVLRNLRNVTQGSLGVQSVTASVNAARVYSQRLAENDLGAGGWPYPARANYSGTAALFTPSGEIRLVINDQGARDQFQDPHGPIRPDGSRHGYPLEERVDDVPTGGAEYRAWRGDGYRDIDGVDYARLPAGAGIAGIVRTGNNSVRVIAPPFAICFDENGHISPGSRFDDRGTIDLTDDRHYIYYDGNGDGRYDWSMDRENPRQPYPVQGESGVPYNPMDWDPAYLNEQARPRLHNNNFGGHSEDYRVTLPFEEIETVTAVILYDREALRLHGPDWNDDENGNGIPDVQEWLLDPANEAKALYLSPQTGLVLNEE
ncbi:MAG: Tfp pilus assembly protein FimT/FimU [Phycisphaeraceae bacterium]